MAGILAFSLAALIVLLAMVFRRRKYRLPPGPKGLPVIGNVWDAPQSFPWVTYQRWSEDYGSDIVQYRIAGTTFIVLNSLRTVQDLLEKRSRLYSDREVKTMFHDLIGWKRNWAHMPYGDKWREHRRMFHEHFHAGAVQKYRPQMAKEAKKLLLRLVEEPEDFIAHIRTMAGSLILAITFGIEVKPKDDPYVLMAEKALQSIAAAGNAGSYLVDYLPILRYVPDWVPGTQFKRDAAEWKKSVVSMFEKPFTLVQRGLAEGNAPPSITATLLSATDLDEDATQRESVIRNVTGTAYVAGADTTVSALGTFMLAMVLNPDVQRAAQAEIDRVIGPERLPEFQDKDNLPIVTAILLETLRWHPVTPLAVAHKLLEDDEYDGYEIPGGSVIIGNAWAILHDAERYPDPEAFYPQRFLTADGKLNRSAPDPTVDGAFGFGRRACAGRPLALDSMWITMALILATLNIEKGMDDRGNVVQPSGEYTSGMLSYPVPFKAKFRPRSQAVWALIRLSSFLPD